jgi:hypothetical protein
MEDVLRLLQERISLVAMEQVAFKIIVLPLDLIMIPELIAR